MKYPALYVYTKTPDNGMELKYSIRSLENVENWNGRVIVVGDREDWFQGIEYVYSPTSHGNPHRDVERKLQNALSDWQPDESFIFMNDDIYCTEPAEVTALHCGELIGSDKTPHQRSKRLTREWLISHGVDMPLDYELHTPIIMSPDKRIGLSTMIMPSFRGSPLLARSMYGNIYSIGGEVYEDKKTKTSQLKEGVFISTQYYTDELDKLFPNPSRFEAA